MNAVLALALKSGLPSATSRAMIERTTLVAIQRPSIPGERSRLIVDFFSVNGDLLRRSDSDPDLVAFNT